ncbi:unnamed protein product [Chironomus riparius]|uniref:CHK kinase-like domain-containing protein n=1 Tax=Chironomus riparius TaxID=315576 RepID=A0A9P0IVG9_9DIPT|nr:unnamed protein product [Chironomus riparius]
MDDTVLKFPNEIYDKALEEVVSKQLNLSKGEYEIKFKEGSSKGDNYNGIIYRVEIIKNEEVKLSIIVKLPPDNPARREEFLIHKSFFQEADFYDNIYPMYKKFQEDKGIDVQKDGFFQVPVCYKTLPDDPHEGLFFEDLKVTGFSMFDRKRDLTKDHIFLVIEALAKMHATYFSIKDQKPELVEKYKDIEDYILKQCRRKEAAMKIFNEKMKNQALDVLKYCKNEELVKRVREVLSPELHLLLEEGNDVQAAEPYAILCHGDCWMNNVMYQYDENGIPKTCILLDHTIMRTKSLRDKYYNEFMSVYFDKLSSFMQRLGSDPAIVFPRDIFESHLKKFGKFGLAMAIILVPMVTSDADDAPEIDDVADAFKDNKDQSGDVMNFTTAKTLKVYEQRMMGIFEDMYNYGYI